MVWVRGYAVRDVACRGLADRGGVCGVPVDAVTGIPGSAWMLSLPQVNVAVPDRT